MKTKLTNKILVLLFVLASFLDAKAATYYVSSSGNDSYSSAEAQNQSTPWKSISKVNSAALAAGDSVLFKRGETFPGCLSPAASGTAVAPIYFGAYGSGSKPVISGLKPVTSWNNLGGNIWESVGSVSTNSSLNMVVVAGVDVPMGRYPNTGKLKVTSYSGSTSITCTNLSSSSVNWTGAELVLFDQAYSLIRRPILSHSGSTLTYDGNLTPKSNKGFFIQNHPKTLDLQNEWYFNPSTQKLRIYSANTPANVFVEAENCVLLLKKRNYLTFDDLEFRGCRQYLVNLDGGTDITIQNCNLLFAGVTAVRTQFNPLIGLIIENCLIKDCHTGGINIVNATNGAQGSIIRGNTIKNIGMLPGMTRTSGSENIIGIRVYNAGHRVEYNNIDYTGACGINFFGDNILIKNNVVNHFDQIVQDLGGIYTWNTTSTGTMVPTTGMKLLGNIVMNGGYENDRAQRDGIYLDCFSNGIEVGSNAVFNVSAGIVVNFGDTKIKVHHNTTFNCENGLRIEAVRNTAILHDVDVHSNYFVGYLGLTNQSAFVHFQGYTYPPATIGSTTIDLKMDYNCYARPLDDTKVIQTTYSGSSRMLLETWQAGSGKDLHSKKSPKTVTNPSDVVFKYNDSKSPLTVSFLGLTYVDIKGVTHVDSLVLPPYSSTVLIRTAGSPTTIIAPSITQQPVSKTVTAGQTATFSVAATGTPAPTYQWKKNGTTISGATSSSYTTPATTTADSGSSFTVVVSNAGGSKISTAATLTVNPASVAPMISTQPVSKTVTVGQTATFSIAATGTPAPTYQWMKNGVVISGATSASYTTPVTVISDSGAQFKVVVSNSAGSVTSSVASLTVKEATVAPVISTQPTSVSVTAGQTATFSVVATGTPTPSYQWMKNGAAISGATSSTYTTPATTTSDNGEVFSVKVSNSAGSVTSTSANLSVTQPPYTVTITSLTLVNADNGSDIQTLNSGAVLNLATLPTKNLAIRANPSSSVGSIIFNLTGTETHTQIESIAPYALYGGTTAYTSWTPSLGSYSLSVTPYSAAKGGGTAGKSMSVNFSVINQPPLAVTSFTLINADTDQPIQTIANGSTITLSGLPTKNLNIRANATGTVGSVVINLSGSASVTTTQNVAPYSVFGDKVGDYTAWNPIAGAYTLKATPWSQTSGSGTVGASLTISFTLK